MADVKLRATNQDGPKDVRLYAVPSGKSSSTPVVVNIYLIPLNKAPANKDKMSVTFT